jgi:hypothetical protein
MGVRWAVLCACVLAGCYQPTFPVGGACATNAECPGGQPCVNNVCGGTASTPDAAVDAPTVVIDAPPPPGDAAPPIEIVIGDDTSELRDAEIMIDELNFGDGDHVSVDDQDFAVMRFELSSISTAATIVSAQLTVRTFDTAGTDGGTIFVHRLRESWEESTVTWDMRNATQAWSTAGALPPSSDGASVATLSPAAINTDYTVDLPIAMVQEWVSSPSENFGVLFVVGTTDVHVHLRSRENSPATRLTLQYQ